MRSASSVPETRTRSLDAEDAAEDAPESQSIGRRVMRWRAGRILLPPICIIIMIGAWEAWIDVANGPGDVLPAPSKIVREASTSWHLLLSNSVVTLKEIVLGFLAGVTIGFICGALIAYSSILNRILWPLLISAQAVPKLAIAPLFIIWFGFGIVPKIVISTLLTFFPIVVTTVQGLTSVDERLLDILRSVSASEWQVFRYIRLPSALPNLFSGFLISITLAISGAIVGEWVGADSGLGYLIIVAKANLEIPLLFAAIMFLVVIGILLFVAIEALRRIAIPWAHPKDTRGGA